MKINLKVDKIFTNYYAVFEKKYKFWLFPYWKRVDSEIYKDEDGAFKHMIGIIIGRLRTEN